MTITVKIKTKRVVTENKTKNKIEKQHTESPIGTNIDNKAAENNPDTDGFISEYATDKQG